MMLQSWFSLEIHLEEVFKLSKQCCAVADGGLCSCMYIVNSSLCG